MINSTSNFFHTQLQYLVIFSSFNIQILQQDPIYLYQTHSKKMIETPQQQPKNLPQKPHQYISKWRWRKYDSKHSLNLYGCNEDWEKALTIKDWSQLKILDLGDCAIDDESVGKFIGFKLYQLENLYLQNNIFSERAMRKFMECEWLNNLVCLKLDFNAFGPQGVKFLIKINIPKLSTLNLNGCYIGDEGLTHLIKSKWNNLKDLSLTGNYIGKNGFDSLRFTDWKTLVNLQIWGNQYCVVTGCTFVLIHTTQKTKFSQGVLNKTMRQKLEEILRQKFQN